MAKHWLRFCFLVALSGCLATPLLHAQGGGNVLPIKKRKEALVLGEDCIDQKDPELKKSFSELRFPFSFKEDEKPPEAVAVVVEAPKEPELTDKDVLDAIAPKINATGTLIKGGVSYLIFTNGQLPDGGTIRLNFRGKTYLIKVANVSSTGYDLILNNDKVRKSFSAETTGTLERDKTD